MEGYIKLFRKTMHSSIWEDPFYFKLWMYCLMKATHKKHDQIVGNQMLELEEGQFITGRQSLSDDLNKGMKPKLRQSETTWWRYLTNLEKWGMLNIKKTTKYSVVSIIKWTDYQESEQQVDNKRTSNEHQMNIKRTSNEQQMDTNKNVKNVKNVKNDKNGKKNSPKQAYDEFSLYYKMADYFYKLILKNNPEHKEPNYQKWADEFRKIVELDKKSKDQVREVMEWVQNDDFEMVNVLSPSKLRKRYDNLYMKSLKGSNIKPFQKPNYESGDEHEGNDEQDSEPGGYVRLYK